MITIKRVELEINGDKTMYVYDITEMRITGSRKHTFECWRI